MGGGSFRVVGRAFPPVCISDLKNTAAARKRPQRILCHIVSLHMARIPILDFTDREIARVFLARDVAEAQRVESLLTNDDIDYATEIEPFVIPPFRIERTGVAFYVLVEQADLSRELCVREGLRAGILENDEERPGDADNDQASAIPELRSTMARGCLLAIIAVFVILAGLLCTAIWMQK